MLVHLEPLVHWHDMASRVRKASRTWVAGKCWRSAAGMTEAMVMARTMLVTARAARKENEMTKEGLL